MKNLLDNKITLSYKAAYEYETSVKYVFINENNEFESVIDLIYDYIERDKNQPLFDIYMDVNKRVKNIYPIHFLYIYIYLLYKEIDERVLNRANAFITKIQNKSLKTFESVDHLEIDYSRWINDIYLEEKDITTKIRNKIIRIQEQLLDKRPLTFSALTITSVTKSYNVRDKNGGEINVLDGIEIFNTSTTSLSIPYIQFNDHEYNSLYKVYDLDNPELYKIIEEINGDFIMPNFIYILIYIKEKGRGMNRSSFMKCTYSIERGTLRLSMPSSTGEDVVQKTRRNILTALPFIRLDEGQEIKIKGHFTLDNIILSLSALHFLILTEDIFNTYLYIEEGTVGLAEKQRLNIHYKTWRGEEVEDLKDESSAASVSISFKDTVKRDLVGYLRNIEINIVKAESREVLDQFLIVFTRLMAVYMERVFEIDKMINSYVLDSNLPEEIGEIRESKKSVNQLIDTKIGRLTAKAPSLFGENYVRKCQCPKQPTDVEDDEISEWEELLIDGEDRRTVSTLPIPGTDDYINLVCPGDIYPHLYEMEGKDKEGNTIYLPCCGKKAGGKRVGRNEKEKKREENREEKYKHNYRISTTKILDPGRTEGNIPKGLVNLLRSGIAFEKSSLESDDFVRSGVNLSPSSFLHCILLAIKDEKYMKKNEEDREKYCHRLREDIADTILPQIYRQELYDLDDEDILDDVADPTIFLDPQLYYRGMEEFFNLNIFTFTIEGNGGIEIPRHQLCHIRIQREDRPSIIILKHVEDTHLRYPQCELIVSRGKIIETEKYGEVRRKISPYGIVPNVVTKGESVFTSTMTLHLYSILYTAQQNYLISSEVRNNPFSQADIERMLWDVGEIVSQEISSYGKTYMIGLKIKGTNKEIALCIPFTQPFNVREMDYTKLTLPSKDDIAILGTPSFITPGGVYFAILDFEKGVFIPTSFSSDSMVNAPYIPPTVFKKNRDHYESMKKSVKDMEVLKLVKRETSILMQLINWCWKLTIVETGELMDIDIFWDKYVKKVGNKVYTKPKNVKRILPMVNTVKEAIDSISWEPYFSSYINLYDELYNRARGYFQREYVMIKGLDKDNFFLSIPTRLSDFYLFHSDFIHNDRDILLLSTKDLTNWLESKQEIKNVEVMSHLDISYHESTDPIIFKDDSTEKIYLLQNVMMGDKIKALYTCEQFSKIGENIGMQIKDMKDEDVDRFTVGKVPYVIYGISLENKMVAIDEKNVREGLPFYQLLKYSKEKEKYAALLPLR
jgi:hypothetical protein